MNREFLHTELSQEILERNLIAALTNLQHSVFDSELLDATVKPVDEAPLEPFLSFLIGSHSFVVSATCFCEVFVETPIASIPNAPDCLIGLSNIRGALIPIYQLHSSLNSKPSKKINIFCLGKGDAAIGILIDELPTSLSLSKSQGYTAYTSENAVLKNFVKACYIANQKKWLLLEGNSLGAQLQGLASRAPGYASSSKHVYETSTS